MERTIKTEIGSMENLDIPTKYTITIETGSTEEANTIVNAVKTKTSLYFICQEIRKKLKWGELELDVYNAYEDVLNQLIAEIPDIYE